MYNILRLVQAFDPSFAATSLSQPLVEELSVIIPIGAHDLIPGLVRELLRSQIQIAFLGTIQQLLRSRRGLCVCASERACVCVRVCVRVV